MARPRRPPRDCFPGAGIACQAPLARYIHPPPPFRPLLSPEPGARSGPTALPPLSAASFSSSTTTRSPRNTAALAPALLSSLLHRPRLLRSIRFYRDVALLAYACISILRIVVTRIIIIFECFDARVLTTLREKIREIREIRSQRQL